MKAIRRKIVSATPPEMHNGAWRRTVTLSCGHCQEMFRQDANRIGRTIICSRCTKHWDEKHNHRGL